MDAIILADRNGIELAPMQRYIAPALIPLLGKPLVQHAIEHCQRAGVTRVFLVVDRMANEIHQLLQNGDRWSLNIHYLYSRPDKSYQSLLQRLNTSLRFPLLVIRGDVVYKNWLCGENDENQSFHCSSASALLCSEQQICDLNKLSWSSIVEQASVEPTTNDFYPLQSLNELHHVLSRAVENQHNLDIPYGQRLNNHVYIGPDSQVPIQSIEKGNLYIANQCHIEADAHLGGTCYLGDNVMINSHARVTNSVVFDNTFIGTGASIDNAIVCGSWIHRVDYDQSCYIDDELLLSKVATEQVTPVFERCLAAIIMVILAPFVLITLCNHWLRSRPTVSNVNYQTNYYQLGENQLERTITPGTSILSTWFAIKHWSLLVAVINGKIRLTGRQATHIATNSSWRENYNDLPVGWFSLSQWLFSSHQNSTLYELQEIEAHLSPFRSTTQSIMSRFGYWLTKSL